MHPLKVERELRGWSQARVAEAIGSTGRTVMRWEMGQVLPQPYYREQLCSLFGKNARELGLFDPAELPEPAPAAPISPKPVASTTFLTDFTIPTSLGSTDRLLGRDELFAELKGQLKQGSSRVALQGLPGIGKTSLAVALTQDAEIQERFKDGILWAGLGLNADVMGHLVRWAKLLDIEPKEVKNAANTGSWGQVLRAAIGKRRMLVVIDDVWSIQDALAMQVGGPNCAYLITSRLPQAAFSFAGEGVVTVGELDEADGVALLARLVPQLVRQDPAGARALVGAVGALPLAITLMGKYLASQSLGGQPRRLQTALKLLQDAKQRLELAVPVTASEYAASLPSDTPLSLQASIALSENQLDDEARTALGALAVFPAKPNSFSEEAALAVSGVTETTLDTLWDSGLLETSGPGRYTLHQTVASYASRLTENTARQRLINYTLEYIDGHSQDFAGLEQEINNITAAFDTALELACHRDLARGVFSLTTFMWVRGLYLLAPRYLKPVLEQAQAEGDLARQVKALSKLGKFAELVADYDQARAYSLAGLELARRIGETHEQADLLTNLGLVAANLHDLDRAGAYFDEALQLTGESHHQCYLYSYRGRIHRIKGEYMKAFALYRQGVALSRRLKIEEATCCLLSNLAYLSAIFGNYAEAREYTQEGLELARRLGHRELLGIFLNISGIFALHRHDYQAAEGFFKEALGLARYIKNTLLECNLLTNLGTAALERQNMAEAESYLVEAVGLARQLDYSRAVVDGLLALANLAERQGFTAKAEKYRQESLTLTRSLDVFRMERFTTRTWGELLPTYQQLGRDANTFYEVLTPHYQALQAGESEKSPAFELVA